MAIVFKRHAFNVLAIACVALATATVILWARSYRHGDVLGFDGSESADRWQRGGNIASGGGALAIQWWRRQNYAGARNAPAPQGWGYTTRSARSPSPPNAKRWFSYEARSEDISRISSNGTQMPKRMLYFHELRMPHFAIVLVAMPGVVLAFRRFTIRRLLLCTTFLAFVFGIANFYAVI